MQSFKPNVIKHLRAGGDTPGKNTTIMKGRIFLTCGFAIWCAATSAQAVRMDVEGRKVSRVTIRNASDEPVALPGFGEKHLLIFYVDPDVQGQNREFTDYLEAHQLNNPALESYGIINLKETILPDWLIRSAARAKERKTGASIYTDPDRLLSRGWGLGDCNGKFVILFVTRDGTIVFARWGKFDENDKKDFYAVVEEYR